jgi:putative Mg2+ transporter-C (MgtC) family protein
MRLEIFAAHPDAMSRVVQGIIQGIMGGIGFIGAGVILRDVKSETVKGLTTAATVWVTAALGIACAMAAWSIVVIAVGLALLTLLAVGWAEALGANHTRKL